MTALLLLAVGCSGSTEIGGESIEAPEDEPVFVLMDGIVGKMHETIEIPDAEGLEIVNRKEADCPPEEYLPYGFGDDLVPFFAPYGSQRISKGNGSGYGLDGYPDNSPENYDMLVKRLINKIVNCKEEICLYKQYRCQDMDVAYAPPGIR